MAQPIPSRFHIVIILGLDYGEKRIGVAVCDELEIAAHPRPTLERDAEAFDRIAEFVAKERAEMVVVGLPLQMDGSEGTASRKVRSFVKGLRRFLGKVPVAMVDERLTTAQAHRALTEMKARRRTRRREVDRMAAQIILQRYLDRRAIEAGRYRDEQ